jgi:hypothetical protein
MTQTAVYYFPQWHADPRNDVWFRPGWTEWELVKAAVPRFPGHAQPKTPVWGHDDEATPEGMTRRCRAARAHGIDAFLFDWYWYDGPFLNRALDEGFLAADTDLRFALMWANHDWADVFPAHRDRHRRPLASARIGRDGFRAAMEHVIERYLVQPGYWRLDGAAYFSIYRLHDLVTTLGGPQAAADELAWFRQRAAQAGAGELHLAATTNSMVLDPPVRLTELGLDSLTSYNWYDHVDFGRDLTIAYADVAKRAADDWPRLAGATDLPYAPNVTVGWDCTPRIAADSPVEIGEWPFLPVLVDNTPESFEEAARSAVAFARRAGGPGYITVNAWNEWTEGAYLEPDTQWGTGHLEALRTAVRDGSSRAGRQDISA